MDGRESQVCTVHRTQIHRKPDTAYTAQECLRSSHTVSGGVVVLSSDGTEVNLNLKMFSDGHVCVCAQKIIHKYTVHRSIHLSLVGRLVVCCFQTVKVYTVHSTQSTVRSPQYTIHR
jgi:hypothetical protein